MKQITDLGEEVNFEWGSILLNCKIEHPYVPPDEEPERICVSFNGRDPLEDEPSLGSINDRFQDDLIMTSMMRQYYFAYISEPSYVRKPDHKRKLSRTEEVLIANHHLLYQSILFRKPDGKFLCKHYDLRIVFNGFGEDVCTNIEQSVSPNFKRFLEEYLS